MRTDGSSEHYVLHTAIQGGNLEITRALLDASAQVDAVASEHFNNERGYNRHTEETALHQSCAKGDLAMCALLLARGADVNAIRKDLKQEHTGVDSPTDDPRDDSFVPSVRCVPIRETALHIAIQKQHVNLTTLLVCAGADASIPRNFYSGDLGDAENDWSDTSAEELCNKDAELLKALKTEWTPETHHLFPADVRASVEAALIIARRQEWPLPDTVLMRVCALAAQ